MRVSENLDPLLVTVPKAARLLGISRTLMWSLIYKDEVPVVKLGRRVLVARQTIDQIVADGLPSTSTPFVA